MDLLQFFIDVKLCQNGIANSILAGILEFSIPFLRICVLYYASMYTRLLKKFPSNKSFFLFGARGTGKTTWVKNTFPNAIYIDLLYSETYTRLVANPSRLSDFIKQDFKDWIIIDEIQMVPELLNEVHRLIEVEKYKFILTGSSARKLRKSGQNLLGGRALTYFMYPLTAIELGERLSLKNYLEFGGLPSVFYEEDMKKYISDYVKTYLQQEIIQEGITRNIGSFSRFLEAASFSQGSVLNISEVGRESSVGRKVVEIYFNILEDLLVGLRLPFFSKKAKRRLINHSKFYFFDVGIYRAIRPNGVFDKPEEIGGIALESLFFQNLLAINDYLQLGYKLYYYRTKSGVEVDFIAYNDNKLHAFEIKSKRNISSNDIRNLKIFRKDYPSAICHVIYGGSVMQYIDGIDIIPFKEALLTLDKILL